MRAFDLGEPDVRIGPDYHRYLLTIPSQPYQALYGVLSDLGFKPIGVDFISHRAALASHLAPDFQTFGLDVGFATLWAARAWSDVRHVPEQKLPEILDISGRFSTYHRLLTLRIRELSDAYRRCLLAELTDFSGGYKSPEHGTLFANGFQTYLEAAIHAFLADAAGLRDLIAETIWRLVLREPSTDVNTLSALLKRTKKLQIQSELLRRVHKAGADGGWLKNLTELRNSVTHIAPLANTHELHDSQIRLLRIGDGVTPIVHYPLTTQEGTLRQRPPPIDFDGDENEILARLQAYKAFVDESGDALLYAADVLRRLVELSTQVRDAAQLRHQMRTITDKDLVGPVVFHGRQP